MCIVLHRSAQLRRRVIVLPMMRHPLLQARICMCRLAYYSWMYAGKHNNDQGIQCRVTDGGTRQPQGGQQGGRGKGMRMAGREGRRARGRDVKPQSIQSASRFQSYSHPTPNSSPQSRPCRCSILIAATCQDESSYMSSLCVLKLQRVYAAHA